MTTLKKSNYRDMIPKRKYASKKGKIYINHNDFKTEISNSNNIKRTGHENVGEHTNSSLEFHLHNYNKLNKETLTKSEIQGSWNHTKSLTSERDIVPVTGYGNSLIKKMKWSKKNLIKINELQASKLVIAKITETMTNLVIVKKSITNRFSIKNNLTKVICFTQMRKNFLNKKIELTENHSITLYHILCYKKKKTSINAKIEVEFK